MWANKRLHLKIVGKRILSAWCTNHSSVLIFSLDNWLNGIYTLISLQALKGAKDRQLAPSCTVTSIMERHPHFLQSFSLKLSVIYHPVQFRVRVHIQSKVQWRCSLFKWVHTNGYPSSTFLGIDNKLYLIVGVLKIVLFSTCMTKQFQDIFFLLYISFRFWWGQSINLRWDKMLRYTSLHLWKRN